MRRDNWIAALAVMGMGVFLVTVTVGDPADPIVIGLVVACVVAVAIPGVYFWVHRH